MAVTWNLSKEIEIRDPEGKPNGVATCAIRFTQSCFETHQSQGDIRAAANGFIKSKYAALCTQGDLNAPPDECLGKEDLRQSIILANLHHGKATLLDIVDPTKPIATDIILAPPDEGHALDPKDQDSNYWKHIKKVYTLQNYTDQACQKLKIPNPAKIPKEKKGQMLKLLSSLAGSVIWLHDLMQPTKAQVESGEAQRVASLTGIRRQPFAQEGIFKDGADIANEQEKTFSAMYEIPIITGQDKDARRTMTPEALNFHRTVQTKMKETFERVTKTPTPMDGTTSACGKEIITGERERTQRLSDHKSRWAQGVHMEKKQAASSHSRKKDTPLFDYPNAVVAVYDGMPSRETLALNAARATKALVPSIDAHATVK